MLSKETPEGSVAYTSGGLFGKSVGWFPEETLEGYPVEKSWAISKDDSDGNPAEILGGLQERIYGWNPKGTHEQIVKITRTGVPQKISLKETQKQVLKKSQKKFLDRISEVFGYFSLAAIGIQMKQNFP